MRRLNEIQKKKTIIKEIRENKDKVSFYFPTNFTYMKPNLPIKTNQDLIEIGFQPSRYTQSLD